MYPRQPTAAPNQAVSSIGWSSGPPPPTSPYVLQPGVVPQDSGVPAPTPPEGLVQAVQTQPLHVIAAMLKEDPGSVNMKGFVGLTPLHKAVLRADPEILQLLLQHKADPNARNEFEETPLHYACKRGLVAQLQMLIDAGGDVTAEDRAGKGAMHHAAHGGNKVCLLFLIEVCGLSTHSRDRNLNTPLHIVCSHGYTDALDFLLRKERSDIFAQDFAGNSALHIAASTGQMRCCWQLMAAGGLGLLHVHNRSGLRPLDMAAQSKGDKYAEAIGLLSFYTNRFRLKTGRPQGPVLAWYVLLFLPIVLYPLLLAVAQLFGAWRGPAMALGLFVCGLYMTQQTHRINHICRWPNPIQCGFFAAGLVHTMIFYFYNIFPSYWNDSPVFALLTVALTVALLVMYVQLLTRDPGVCRESCWTADGTRHLGVQDVAKGALRQDAFCGICEIVPPTTSHHCKICCFCLERLDHHCLFLYRCIAIHNHRLFVLFIALCLCNMLLFLWCCFSFLGFAFNGWAFGLPLLWEVFFSHPWAWSLMLANATSAFWGAHLLRFQLKVIARGHTTVYRPNPGRCSLSRQLMINNILRFFRGLPPGMVDLPPMMDRPPMVC